MTGPAKIRILSVDDHPLLREGLAVVIDLQPDMIIVAQAASGAEAIRCHREHRPDVTLMDLRLPDMSGIEAIVTIRGEVPEARFIILTTFKEDADVQRALHAGAQDYVLKSTPPSELADVIRQVHAGNRRVLPASPDQIEIHVEQMVPRLRAKDRARAMLQGLRRALSGK